EQERGDWPAGGVDADARAADGGRDGLRGLLLPDDLALQDLLQADQLFGFGLDQLVEGDLGHGGYGPGNVLGRDVQRGPWLAVHDLLVFGFLLLELVFL